MKMLWELDCEFLENRMKKGDFVVCINPHISGMVRSFLTKGKLYEIKRILKGEGIIYVEDKHFGLRVDRFTPVTNLHKILWGLNER